MRTKTILITLLALFAFAANSVLCRRALGGGAIDAAGFTVIRLLSGALMLGAILLLPRSRRVVSTTGSWFASLLLFVYAAAFSYAYITLDTGTGALILFGAVQITMIVVSRIRGVRLHAPEWAGVLIAFGGFVYLVLPGLRTPSLTGFGLMTTAGIAWGLYTLVGRASGSPLSDTAFNFLRSTPLVLLLLLPALRSMILSTEGVLLAVLSGAIASGVGYSLWYLALPGLSATQAAVVQLLVPLIAAGGGVVLLGERLTSRLLVSSAAILGGILLVLLGRRLFAGSTAAASKPTAV